jgi:hypothetical protein
MVIVLVLMVLGIIGDKDLLWAMLPAMGGVIGIFLTLALLGDGSITTNGGATVIVSASTSGASDWQFIEMSPVVITLGSFMVALWKGVRSL